MDDVGGVALAEPGPQGARTSQRAGDALLALVALPGDLGEQRGRVLVGSGRVGQDAVNGPDAVSESETAVAFVACPVRI